MTRGGSVRLKIAVGNVGDRQKNRLIEPAILRLASADSEHGLSTKAINQIILDYHGPITLLRTPKFRNTITDALGRDDARSLGTVLGTSVDGDIWEGLRTCTIRKNSKKETALFDWFEVPASQRPHVVEVIPQPDIEEVRAQHGLFPHQRKAIERLRTIMSSERRRAFLHMPTGSGKTRTAMNFVCESLNRSENCLVVWLAFNAELCEQAASEFQTAWGSLGNRSVSIQRFWGQHGEPNFDQEGIIFIGLDKLWNMTRRNNAWLYNLAEKIKLAVFDEAHQAAAETYSLMLDVLMNSEAKLLGLSATPGRTYNDPVADEELSNIFFRQKITLEVEGYSSPLDYLIQEEYLSKTDFRKIESNTTQIPASELARLEREGDYSSAALELLSQDELRNLLILNHVQSLVAEGHRRILVFANSVSHANLLSAYMKMKSDISCQCITGVTPLHEREHWIARFKDSSTEPIVLFNFGVLTTGFDAPQTSAAIISRPTTSLVLYSQMVGRVIRGHRVGGTKEAVVLTVIDQHLPGFRDLSEAFLNWEDVWDDV